MKKIIILILAFVACLIVYQAHKDSIDIWYLITPILLLFVLGVISVYLKKEFGKTFGIPAFLTAVFIVVAAQYFFCKYFPVSSSTFESQRKNTDLESFENYEGSVDAKIEFTKLQRKNDSLTKIEVAKLLNDGKIDEATALIKTNEEKLEKIKTFLFKRSTKEKNNEEPKTAENPVSNETLVGRVKDNTTAYFIADRPFSIILSLDEQANYITHEMPAGSSSFTFDNGGYVRVVGSGRTDVKMK